MTKEELLARLNDIEWNDFEVKEASVGLPKSMWETVSAFSNTEGGWIILGVKEKKTADGSVYVVNGVSNPEQMEQDIITTLRSRTKFNAPVSCKVMRYKIDGKDNKSIFIPATWNLFIKCAIPYRKTEIGRDYPACWFSLKRTLEIHI